MREANREVGAGGAGDLHVYMEKTKKKEGNTALVVVSSWVTK
jgi:hypothetical protein